MSLNPSRVQELFLAVIEHPIAERDEFLDRECGGDSGVRQRVQALLAAHELPGRFLEAPAVAILDPDGLRQPPQLDVPIGPYILREQIGEGGFGLVYLAEQERPIRRKVAIKVIKPGMDTREVVARFEVERQALALMDHPHIAKVLDAGTTDAGHPYFVMELVRGWPITEYCDRTTIPLRERLKLFITVCDAVQHAHQKGVVHRDLKPSNVLITLNDGTPVPKVIDFGVAKALNQRLTERTFFTRHAQILGTPMYMSPEQAESSGIDVDTRSDVYSLGVLLYELLTGQTPFDRAAFSKLGYDELRKIVREVEPLSPSVRVSTLAGKVGTTAANQRGIDERQHSRMLRGELDWIAMKALDKDRTRRYASAESLAADLQRYLDDKPVEAGRPSTMYQIGKMARRHKAWFAVAALTCVGLLAGMAMLVGTTVLVTQQRDIARIAVMRERDASKRAAEDHRVALQQRDAAEYNLYVADVNLARQQWKAGHVARMAELLDAHRPQPDRPDLRGWEWHYLSSLKDKCLRRIPTEGQVIFNLDWSSDGRWLATAGNDVRLWDVAAERRTLVIAEMRRAAWSPDGRQLAVYGDSGFVKILDPVDGNELSKFAAGWAADPSLAWSPDGRRLAAGDQAGRVTIWDTLGSREPVVLHDSLRKIRTIAWSPDGELMAVAGDDGGGLLEIWNAVAGTLQQSFRAHSHYIQCMAWSPDGRWLGTGSQDQYVKVWRVDDWTSILNQRMHAGRINALDWSPDSRHLVSVSDDSTIRVWDPETRRLVNTLCGHLARVHAVAWSPDGAQVATAGADGMIRFW
ncbi:MAG: serine/threonine protein kinase, partial [Planctomycetaceae bacterium]|nr:serine/threonine protein kinase [Planctomycetaceae bacterium]